MYKCAFCGKMYKTAPERSKCELTCQGITIPEATAVEPEATNKHPELADLGNMTKETPKKGTNRNLDRRKYVKQRAILQRVASLAQAINEYEGEFDEIVIPTPEFGAHPFCVFLDPDNSARVQAYDLEANEYRGYVDFHADQCDGDCALCDSDACFKYVRELVGIDTPEEDECDCDDCDGSDCSDCSCEAAQKEPDVPTCNGDCARCAQSRGSRATAPQRVFHTVTPDELMLMFLGLLG